MDYRVMKNTGKKISLLGLGCMRFPLIAPDRTEIDEEYAERMIARSLAQGINYFDTAYPYHEEMSEPFVGRVLKKYPRDSFYLASKLPMWDVNKEEDVAYFFEKQLERCQVEYFDFYLCHNLSRERFDRVKKFGVFEKLLEYKKQGKIRHIGFSFHDVPEVLEEICAAYPWEFGQLQLNYLDWEFQDAKSQYEILERYGIPCIVMEPVRGGALADLGEEGNKVLKALDENASIASWAIRYAASLPNVMTVLSGMSNDEQLTDNLNTLSNFQPLSQQEREAVEKALKIYQKTALIPCTRCRYCSDCPVEIDIPLIFRLYNQLTLSKNTEEFLTDYHKIEASARADRCISCGNCVSHCPQNIQVPGEMEKIAAYVSGAK